MRVCDRCGKPAIMQVSRFTQRKLLLPDGDLCGNCNVEYEIWLKAKTK